MRVPKPMPDALEASLELVESAGLFTGVERAGQAKTQQGAILKQHLVSTVKALVYYSPRPMSPSNKPNHTTVIWAQKGLSETGNEDYVKLPANGDLSEADMGQVPEGENQEEGLKSWFLAKRSAFGPNGWDKLVCGDVDCHVIDGADHFSMVVPPKVCLLLPPSTTTTYYSHGLQCKIDANELSNR